MKKKWLLQVWMVICFGLLTMMTYAQKKDIRNVNYTEEDRTIFQRYLTAMESHKGQSMDSLLMATARFFLGTPYVASTLEQEPEQLVVNLRELDCSTFVDNVLALSRTIQEPSPSFDVFCQQLQSIRYRKGIISDYTDRLHYTTDWVYENSRKGFVKDVTKEVGGVPLPLQVSFMSTHPGSYKQLKGNTERIRKIAEKELEINRRSYFYILGEDINKNASLLKDGDIVCFVTSIPGLDTAHLGLICWAGDKLTFIHASSVSKKVIVNEDPLAAYVAKVKKDIGILIARPLPVLP